MARLGWLGLLAAGGALFSLVGCAQIIGAEKRNSLGLVRDEETGLTTTQQCIDYCDEVMAACTADFEVYTTRETCIGTCDALDPGDPNEPAGNTVACRHDQAQAAADQEAPDEFCPSAGPAAGEACGDDCEAYCQLLQAACPDEFTEVEDCVPACAGLTDAGTFNTGDFYTGDTLQCRLIHVSASFDDPAVHCAHAKFDAEALCVNDTNAEPDCDEFCRNVMAACPGDLVTYESQSQCMATCAEWPVGDVMDRMALTIGCREYHSGAALADADIHCKHTGPGGDGVCTATAAAGNCEGYCFSLERACPDAFIDAGGTQEACLASCLTDFADNGAAASSGYSVVQALAGDSLQCHMLMLSRALDGEPLACDHVRPGNQCPPP